MFKFGLEKEFFLLDPNNNPVPIVGEVSTLPVDECGYLVEARGNPKDSIIDAVYDLNARIYEIGQKCLKFSAKYSLSDFPYMVVSKRTRDIARRNYTKGPIRHNNIYGFSSHRNSSKEGTASVHISFTKPIKVEGEKGATYTTYSNFDWPFIFTKLDKAFALEISKAKRRPGFYEVKHDGRVEYRSLPSNVDLYKLIEVVQEIMKTII